MSDPEEPTVSTTTTALRAAATTLAAIAALAATAAGADAATQTRVMQVRPAAASSTTIQAVPTNESSKQQRQACTQWTVRLQAAQGVTLNVNGSVNLGGPSAAVEAIADQAMSDGCFVLF